MIHQRANQMLWRRGREGAPVAFWSLVGRGIMTALVMAGLGSASAFAESPVLQVRSIPLRGANLKGIRDFEISMVCPVGKTFLCIEAVSEVRKWPYRDGDTYEGSGLRETKKIIPKVSMRIRVEGKWRQLPAIPEASDSVPRFAPLSPQKKIMLGHTGVVKGNLNEVEVKLTQKADSRQPESLTLRWTPDH